MATGSRAERLGLGHALGVSAGDGGATLGQRWHNGTLPSVVAMEQGSGLSSLRFDDEERPMIRVTRTMAAIVLATLLALAWAIETDGGGRATPAEREAALARIQQVQEQLAVRRELEDLYRTIERFVDVDVAAAAGYAPASECMTSALGAQGIHFANDALFEPVVVVQAPQLLMYEPRPDGSLRFLGVEYLVFQEAWHEAGHEARPVLFGQEFRLNETLLDEPFYLLHVWIGQFNPSGVFADWNPLVGCAHEAAIEWLDEMADH